MKEQETIFDIEVKLLLERHDAELKRIAYEQRAWDWGARILFVLMLLYIAALCAPPYFEDDNKTSQIEVKP